VTDKYYRKIVCCQSKAKYAADNAAVMIFDTSPDSLKKVASESPRTARVLVQT
jgi:hypothetical protein